MLLVVLRQPLFGPFITHRIEAAVKEHGDLRIDSLGGSWIDATTLRGVEWRSSRSPLRSIEGGDLLLEYSLWDALRGRPGWLRTIRFRAERAEIVLAEEESEDANAQLALPSWLDGSRVRLDVELVSVTVPGKEPVAGEARLDARFLKDGIEVGSLRFGPWVSFEGRLEEGLLDGHLLCEDLPVGWVAALAGPGPESPSGRVSLEASGRVPLDDPRAAELDARATAVGLAWRSWRIDEVEAVGSLRAGTLEIAELRASSGGNTAAAKGLRAELARGSWLPLVATLRGEIDLLVMDLPSILPDASKELPAHEIELSAKLGEGGLAVITGDLRTPAGNAVVRTGTLALGESEDGFLDAGIDLGIDVNVEDLALLGAILGRELPLGGTLQAELAITGTPRRPAAALTLRAEAIDVGGTVLEGITAKVVADAQGIRVERLEGTTKTLGRVLASGYVPLSPDGEVRIVFDSNAGELSAWNDWLDACWFEGGTVAIRADLSGAWTRLAGKIAVEARDVALTKQVGEVPSLKLDVEAELADEILVSNASFRWGESMHAVFTGSVGTEANVVRALDDPASYLGAPLRLQAELALPDLAWLARRLDTVSRLRGEVRARGELVGTLGNPSLTGELEVRDGELRLGSEFPALRALSADVALAAERWTIESLTGEIGGAPFRLSGSVDLGPEDPELDLVLKGTNLLLHRSPRTKVRASVDLNIRGSTSALRTTGEIVLTEGRHTRSLDLFESLRGRSRTAERRGFFLSFWREPPLANMELDVTIKTAEAFRIENNVTRASLRPDLRLTGTGEVPLLTGLVYIDPSTISLPSGRLRVRSGLLQFLPDAPFLPELSLSAEMRLRGYDIEAHVSGPYDRPEIVLTSSPPLANDDLLVLFLTGQSPTGTLGERGMGAAETVGVYVAQDVLSRWLFEGDPDDEEDILDRLDVEIGAEISRSGSPTARATLYLKSRLRGTGRNTYLTTERDAFDRINYGFGLLFRFR